MAVSEAPIVITGIQNITVINPSIRKSPAFVSPLKNLPSNPKPRIIYLHSTFIMKVTKSDYTYICNKKQRIFNAYFLNVYKSCFFKR